MGSLLRHASARPDWLHGTSCLGPRSVFPTPPAPTLIAYRIRASGYSGAHDQAPPKFSCTASQLVDFLLHPQTCWQVLIPCAVRQAHGFTNRRRLSYTHVSHALFTRDVST